MDDDAAGGDDSGQQRPSLANPTWEYLYENFKKADLQNHCRQLGLQGIWTTKEKLIDKIVGHSRSNHSSGSHSEAASESANNSREESSAGLLHQRMERFVLRDKNTTF